MSTIDLLILGNLLNGSKSAYAMKKELEAQNIRHWVKVGMPTVYQNIIKLHRKGFLDARTVKESEMPEKTIYTINEKGKNHFQELMNKYSEQINSIYFDFCSFVVNLDHVDKDIGLCMVENLKEQFYQKKLQLDDEVQKKKELPFQALSILKLYNGLFDFLYKWSEELKENYQEEKNKLG